MSDIWFSSDLHAYHKAVMDFCPSTRRGGDSEEMTELMLEAFNKLVKPEDTLYLLGDVSFGGKDKVESFISRLPGKKILILGNHDFIIKRKDEFRAYFHEVRDIKSCKIGENRFIMSHAPFAEWVDCHKGVIHLHGHLHGNKTNVQWQQQYKIMDVGIDARPDNLMTPWHLDEVLSFVKDRAIMTHHDQED